MHSRLILLVFFVESPVKVATTYRFPSKCTMHSCL